MSDGYLFFFLNKLSPEFPSGQWLTLYALTTKGPGSVAGRGMKIPPVPCGQNQPNKQTKLPLHLLSPSFIKVTIFLFLYKSSLYVMGILFVFYLCYFLSQFCYVMYGKYFPRFCVCLLDLFMVHSVIQMLKHFMSPCPSLSSLRSLPLGSRLWYTEWDSVSKCCW